jgi:arylsulfatase A-like enzyme
MRSTVMGTFAILAGAIIGSVAVAAETGEKLNVLFIAVDDMRPQLGCYGDKLVKTPHMDRLAARGVVFDRAYCQQALCSPSRISLLSGRRPSTSGIYQIGPTLRSAMPDVVTLPQHFKNHGYFARSLGKIYHVGIDDPDSWSVPSWVSKAPRYGPTGQAAVKQYIAEMKAAGKEIPTKGKDAAFYAGPAFESPEVDDDALTDGDTCREAVAAMKELAGKPQPFFLAVGFVNPHVPWVAPKKYFDLYDLDALDLPDNQYRPRGAPAYAATCGQDFFWYGNVPKDQKIDDAFGRQCLRGYLAAISYIDAQVGRLLDALDEQGLAKNTVVVLWGDHGYYMGEHGWWGGKHNTYEGATHAPLLVAVPGMKTAGQHTAGLTEFVDIYPSLVEICGLPAASGVEGTSFAPLLIDPKKPWKKAAFSEYPKGARHGTTMRTDRYRYTVWTDKSGEVVDVELYDHRADPAENQNIASTADKALLDELAKQFRAGWQGARPE